MNYSYDNIFIKVKYKYEGKDKEYILNKHEILAITQSDFADGSCCTVITMKNKYEYCVKEPMETVLKNIEPLIL